MSIQLDETQLLAVENAVNNDFWIINGGAGVGKSTVCKEIYRRLGDKVEFCAFMGKAAARLRQATGHRACTIHKLLDYNGVTYRRDDLSGVSVILDEASTAPANLISLIIRAKPDRLILVGDQAQLPPVGRGQPFHDMLEAAPEKVTTLTKCYRNKEAVFKAGSMIRAGEYPLDSDKSENEIWGIQGTGDATLTHQKILELVREGHMDFTQDIILCPKRGDSSKPCTVHSLNADIVKIVNPRPNPETKFLPGDRVICVKNYASHDVWNGTTGTIEEIDQQGCAFVHLDVPATDPDTGEELTEVHFSKDMMRSLELAYALTVHKSQGSQYRNVILVTLNRDRFGIMDRSLVYTGVTRAQHGCIVMGNQTALRNAINKVQPKKTVMRQVMEGRDAV